MSSPSPQWFDVLLVDINGICRGYQTPLAEHHNLLTNGLFWPYSLFSLRYDGAVVEETASAFRRRPGLSLSITSPKRTVRRCGAKAANKRVFSLCTPEGNDFFADPQTALKRFTKIPAEGLSVVLAVELEFYLV